MLQEIQGGGGGEIDIDFLNPIEPNGVTFKGVVNANGTATIKITKKPRYVVLMYNTHTGSYPCTLYICDVTKNKAYRIWKNTSETFNEVLIDDLSTVLTITDTKITYKNTSGNNSMTVLATVYY